MKAPDREKKLHRSGEPKKRKKSFERQAKKCAGTGINEGATPRWFQKAGQGRRNPVRERGGTIPVQWEETKGIEKAQESLRKGPQGKAQRAKSVHQRDRRPKKRDVRMKGKEVAQEEMNCKAGHRKGTYLWADPTEGKKWERGLILESGR